MKSLVENSYPFRFIGKNVNLSIMKKELSDLLDNKIAESNKYYAGKPTPSMKELNKVSSKEKNLKEIFNKKKTVDSFVKCFENLA